jgi:hypothetical protein
MTDTGVREVETVSLGGVQAVAKDLSLISLVPRWAGTNKSGPLHEFIKQLEDAASLGNWSDSDKRKVASLKLTDAARRYNSAPEFHGPDVTWATFKKTLQDRFRDTRTIQFHYAKMHAARQKSDESALDFADRLRELGKNIQPTVTDPAGLRSHDEHVRRMVLVCFTKGLRGTAGIQVGYKVPNTLEALQIDAVVEQTEQDRKGGTFYLGERKFDAKRDQAANREPRGENRKRYSNRRPRDRDREKPKDVSGADKMVCYECNGTGHMARECATRLNKQKSRNHPPPIVRLGNNEGPRVKTGLATFLRDGRILASSRRETRSGRECRQFIPDRAPAYWRYGDLRDGDKRST